MQDYEHAPNMYNLDAMKNRGLKFGAGIVTLVVSGIAIPWVRCLPPCVLEDEED